MYSIKNYGEMILDATRMDAYVAALRGAVTPGAVVLDIGTGTGIFAMLACQLGARRVFAVDPSDSIVVAEEIAAANGLSRSIEFFQAMSTEITLPERADVVISDMHGVLPQFRRHLVAIKDARERHLAPGGAMIPARESIWAAVVEAPEQFHGITSPWSDNAYGLDMSAARRMMTNTCFREAIRHDQLLADPKLCGTLDHQVLDSPHFNSSTAFSISRPGRGHGLCLWFDSILAEGIELSNAPDKPRLIYGRLYLPWPEPVDLKPGQKIAVTLRADLVGDEYVWGWDTRIGNGAAAGRHFSQSEFLGELLSPATLRKQAAGHVPGLGEDGHIDRIILQLMDEQRPLGDIAREVAARFPVRFVRWQDALTRVGDLSLRYGR